MSGLEKNCISNDDSLFGRVVTAMATPFDKEGKVDYEALEKLVEHLIATKTNTILVAGTTGESPTLDKQEKLDVLKKVIELSKKRVKVIFGAGSNNTAASVEMSKAAEQAGAEGLLIVAPYYNKPSQAGIIAHVKAVSDSTKLPILVYNIPGRCGINIEPKTMIEMINECDQVRAIKDSAGNVDQTAELARLVAMESSENAKRFRIYSGDDYLTLPMLSVGACGVVSVASHLIGEQISEMISAALAGDVEKARSIHYRYLPVFKGLFIAPNPTCLKYLLSCSGIGGETLRLPLISLTSSQKEAMDKLAKEAELLSKVSV